MKKLYTLITLLFFNSIVFSQFSLNETHINPKCHLDCNGIGNVIANNAIGIVTYTWLPQGTISYSLCAGQYTVIAEDQALNTASITINISDPPILTSTTTQTNTTCANTCLGRANVTSIGGTPPYNYYWNYYSGNNNVTNLCVGEVLIQTLDSKNCSFIDTITITDTEVPSIPNAVINSITNYETCQNSGDGAISLNISGVNPNSLSYKWSNGAITQNIISIYSNIYWVNITDTNFNCMTLIDTVGVIGINCGTISGNVFIDNNSDCLKNSGDNNFIGASIIANPGNRLGYSNANGDYTINSLPYGTYTITSSNNSNMIGTCTTTINSTINSGTPNSVNNNFAKEYVPITQPDLYVSAYSNGIVPGFVCRMNYYCYNYNTFNANGIFKATLPSAFIPNITNVFPSNYTLSADTIIWNFANINYMNWSPNFYIDFTTPLSTPLGSTFTSCMWAQPTVADLNYPDNSFCYQRTVTGSYDPNDKTVSPVGVGATGDIAASVTDLTYLIRFQNTGNGPAVNIFIKDTLSTNVDVNTFEMLGSSHNYIIDILPGNILRWKFNNIMLPDSNSNEPGSHGYVQYRIKRTNNNTPGTQIKNTAYIYFDFNEPIVTNTAINTIETITGIKSSSSNSDEWNVYPNPSSGALYIVNSSSVKETSQVQVLNAIGQTVLEENISSNYKNMDLSKLNNGVYFVKIVSDKSSTVKRIVLSK